MFMSKVLRSIDMGYITQPGGRKVIHIVLVVLVVDVAVVVVAVST